MEYPGTVSARTPSLLDQASDFKTVSTPDEWNSLRPCFDEEDIVRGVLAESAGYNGASKTT